jgi:hypothetical protein
MGILNTSKVSDAKKPGFDLSLEGAAFLQAGQVRSA